MLFVEFARIHRVCWVGWHHYNLNCVWVRFFHLSYINMFIALLCKHGPVCFMWIRSVDPSGPNTLIDYLLLSCHL